MPAIAVALLGLGIGTSGRAADATPPRYPHNWAAGGVDPTDNTVSPVRDALREGRYPWYDPATDRLRPIWPPKRTWVKWLGDRVENSFKAIGRFLRPFNFSGVRGLRFVGESIGTMLLMAVLVTFFVGLVVLWARRDRLAADRAVVRTRLGTVARVAELPEGIRPGSDDPWDEARQRRAAGDYSGAIVCLFAHQLLSLDQLGLIRLGPGRTGRYYVRGLRDRELLDPVRATLVLFEDVYYGRRAPEVKAFEAVWSRAQAFEERRSVLGASR